MYSLQKPSLTAFEEAIAWRNKGLKRLPRKAAFCQERGIKSLAESSSNPP